MHRPLPWLAALWCAAAGLAQNPAPPTPTPPTPTPPMPTQSPESKLPAVVEAALTTAKQKNQRVLVVWPGDGPAGAALVAALKGRTLSRQLLYEFVQAPLTKAEDAARLGLEAAPGLIVLAADGKRLGTWGRFDLEPIDAAKLGKELTPLHAEPLDAQVLFDAALATAKKAQKRLLIHFDAPW